MTDANGAPGKVMKAVEQARSGLKALGTLQGMKSDDGDVAFQVVAIDFAASGCLDEMLAAVFLAAEAEGIKTKARSKVIGALLAKKMALKYT
jgi:hypothetical protein